MNGADSLRLPNGKLRRLKPSPAASKGAGEAVLPLGLLPVPNVAQGDRIEKCLSSFGFDENRFSGVEPLFFSRQAAELYRRQKIEVSLSVPEASKRVGFSLSRFRSGEVTGGRFFVGSDSKVSLHPRSGQLVTQSLTQKARTKIRRSIQNANHDFKCFLTVTFSPGHLKPWECDKNGTVRHDFAKYKFKKFLHSIKQSYDRKADASTPDNESVDHKKLLAYVWVAELQKNGNIHFHVLLNQRPPIKWLTKLWNQAGNSIDVRSINNLNHASCYIRKYMEKEKSAIQGNRYAITQGLRKTMQPEKTVIDGRAEQAGVFSIIRGLQDTIEVNGGKVLEHGFYLPTPSRSVSFRGKDGTFQKTVAVNAGVGRYLVSQISAFVPELPF